MLASPKKWQAHPQASLIPLAIGQRYFDYDLSDELIQLMQIETIETNEALLECLKNYKAPKNINDKKKTWLALVISHPQLSLEQLEMIRKHLKLSKRCLYEMACITGNILYLRELDASDRPSLSNFGEYFLLACENGQLEVLQFLSEKAPERLQVMIRAEDFYAFKAAAENGHIDVLQFLVNLNPDQLKTMINDKDFYAFQAAAENGHLEVLQFLVNLNPDQLKTMINDKDFYAFKAAAENGHLKVLQFLLNNNPDQLNTMTINRDFYAFKAAAENGHLEVLQFLVNNNPDQLEMMISDKDFYAFKAAAENGHLKVLEFLVDKNADQLNTMINDQDFYAFKAAAKNGHHEVLRFLSEIAPDKLNDLIQPEYCHTLFLIAAENGYLEVIKFLTNNAPIPLKDMIEYNDFNAFKYAAQNGRLEILQYLADKAHGQLHSMIMAEDFYAFRCAASNGFVQILHFFATNAADQLNAMISVHNFYPFYSAALNNRLPVLEFLAKNAADQLEKMISIGDFCAFKSTNKTIIQHFFLSHPAVFIYAEEHANQCIAPFLDKLFSALYNEKALNPNAIFDVDDQQKVELLFYSLRYLIRINRPANKYLIDFLLAIPKLKAILHTEVRQGPSNELLRLALAIRNQEAALLLMNIPEVMQLARENNYYEDEQQGNLNLRELAQDNESSMTGLTNSEEKRLKNIKKHYENIRGQNWLENEEKIDAEIDTLREELKTRYLACPGRINVGAQEVELPFTWEEFQSLDIKDSERTQALQTYYRHPDHTAWRYLANPNPWLHQNAEYLSETGDRCSTFESYKKLIALLYVAANDKEIPDTEGYTQPARLTLFIQELALIGRAHNWDKTRPKTYENQDLLFIEEYDDNEGDKPACFSGAKRRLLQSLLGHPFLNPPTKDILIMELEETVKKHFQKVITASNRTAIKAIWDKTIMADNLTAEEITLLQTVNISQKQQDDFIETLKQKYGEEFSLNARFYDLIKKAFKLPGESDAHLLRFGHLNLDRFMNEPIKSESICLSENRQQVGFFKQQKEENLILSPNLNPNEGSSPLPPH